MKRVSLVLVIVLSSFLSVRCATADDLRAPTIQARINELQRRIDQGVHSGELTRREAVRVQTELDRIRAKRARFRADGYLGPRERQILHHELDVLEGLIYRLKHNERRRW